MCSSDLLQVKGISHNRISKVLMTLPEDEDTESDGESKEESEVGTEDAADSQSAKTAEGGNGTDHPTEHTAENKAVGDGDASSGRTEHDGSSPDAG